MADGSWPRSWPAGEPEPETIEDLDPPPAGDEPSPGQGSTSDPAAAPDRPPDPGGAG